MRRRFREHHTRHFTDLTGIWDFAFLGNIEPDEVDVTTIRFDEQMSVPGCFDATPRYAGKRGLVAYRTDITLTDKTRHRLFIDGLHHWGRVFLNGKHLCDHSNGFTRFSADIAGHQPGKAALVILVDNRFNYDRSPLHLDYYDWYHFGGISRGVELHRLGEIWIDALTVTTKDIASRQVTIRIQYASDKIIGEHAFRIVCDNNEIVSETLKSNETSGEIERTCELQDAELWSPNEPNLHMLRVQLADDDMCARIGIRQVRTEGQDILINNVPIRLMGFCRHEAHPQFGHTQPEQLLISDVQQLKDIGCNFVRGSHYPQDPMFLDLCDEAGICVWCESNAWGNVSEQITDSHFIDAQLTDIREMISASINHPSVMMWGVLNEGESKTLECKPAYDKLLKLIRELDPTRPVTYASMYPFDDVCFDLANIISINCYPGWYFDSIEEIPQYLDKVVSHLDSVGQGEKPLIISEIGAGAVPGWSDWNEARWTEQYQARLLEVTIRHILLDNNRINGLSIWQFCDLRTSETARRALGRPRGFNNKGVVDEYRRPKLAYDVVKRLFRQARTDSH